VSEPALFRWFPALAARVPWAVLGDWPTPLDTITIDGRPVWVKREGDSSARYGGNKVRTLEAWLGHARASNASRIWATGAYGSNHAIATILHARAIGVPSGAILFPQPASEWACENAGAVVATGVPIVRLRSVVELPFVTYAIERRDRRAIVMPPGGATPLGTFGALSAALELCEQIEAGVLPAPARIVLPIGSTCTTAGLVAGVATAQAIGRWSWPTPIIHAVRVTPWPITSRVRTAHLAVRTLARLVELGGPRVELGLVESVRRLVVDTREFGPGYGRTTPRARDAMALLADGAMPRLDGVYSAKATAALLRLHRAGIAPLLFWATKSTVRLAGPSRAQLGAAPRGLVRWLAG
jgi:D-cysteine desulfhydrase